MTKRRNTFEDTFSQQQKIHVSIKEVSNGVCRDEHMKAVYERTVKLLFDGAKNLSRSGQIVVTQNKIPLPVPRAKTSSKQMCLTREGKLDSNGISTLEEEMCTTLEQCSSCNGNLSSPSHKCYFCELRSCEACLRPCPGCKEIFCGKCSVTAYKGNEELTLCYSCYR